MSSVNYNVNVFPRVLFADLFELMASLASTRVFDPAWRKDGGGYSVDEELHHLDVAGVEMAFDEQTRSTLFLISYGNHIHVISSQPHSNLDLIVEAGGSNELFLRYDPPVDTAAEMKFRRLFDINDLDGVTSVSIAMMLTHFGPKEAHDLWAARYVPADATTSEQPDIDASGNARDAAIDSAATDSPKVAEETVDTHRLMFCGKTADRVRDFCLIACGFFIGFAVARRF